jgi:S-(hydroxymethyl)glutathione dehydrogenase/alcohol dehydrogenase
VGGEGSVELVLELTRGFGADYTFEATGNVHVMRQAVEAARMGWGLCTIAGVAGKGEVLEVVPRHLITGRRIAGASFGGAKGRDRVPELVRTYLDGRLDLESFVTARMPLEQVGDAFAAMERQEGIRTVLTF